MGPRHLPLIFALLCALGSTTWCIWAENQLSATFDEPVYLQCGMDCWRNHTHKPLMRLGTMPLPVDLVTLPIFLEESFSERQFDLHRDFEEMLRIARSAALIFWWNLLFQAWRLGNWVGGPWCGFWLVAFTAWEPNLLGHACLATTDIAVTGCLFGLVNAYLRWRNDTNSKIKWWFVVLWWGLSLFAKASSLAFAPLLLVSIELSQSLGQWLKKEPLGFLFFSFLGRFRDQVLMGLWAFALAFILCGSDWTTESTFVTWAQRLDEGILKSLMVFLSENLTIFTNAGEGFAQQIKHNMRGHPSYLLGIAHEKAVWYHFPVLLLIKLPTTFFLVLPVLLFQQIRRPWAFGVVATVLFLAFSVNCRVQIGIRLLFPLVFLITALAAFSWHEWLQKRSPELRRILGLGLFALLIYQGFRQFPDGIRYINDFWGQGERWDGLVSDSNYDWGQGLVELANHPWARESGNQGLSVLYWGGADPRANTHPLQRIDPASLKMTNENQIRNWLGGKRIAVGATILYGPPLNSPFWEGFRQILQKETPREKTRCFFLFDFSSPS